MSTKTIPKIIHQTYKTTELPEHWKESYTSWKALETQGWEYKFWTDISMREFIATEYNWFLEHYDQYPKPINRVDVWRYFALYHYGGLYVDLDIVCKPREFLLYFNLLETEEVVLPQTKSGNGVEGQNLSNCMMLSQPHSNFWIHLWHLLKDPYRVTPYKATVGTMSSYYNVLFITGPGIVSDAYHTYPQRDQIYLLPAQLCQPLDDSIPKPHDTRQSIVKIIDGSSWHEPSVNFWKSFGFFSKYGKEILGILLACSFIVIIVLSVLLSKLSKASKTLSNK